MSSKYAASPRRQWEIICNKLWQKIVPHHTMLYYKGLYVITLNFLSRIEFSFVTGNLSPKVDQTKLEVKMYLLLWHSHVKHILSEEWMSATFFQFYYGRACRWSICSSCCCLSCSLWFKNILTEIFWIGNKFTYTTSDTKQNKIHGEK